MSQDKFESEGFWHKGEPPHPWNKEWFLAKVKGFGTVVLRALPKEFSYQYTTADDSYFKSELILAWAQLPDSEYNGYKCDQCVNWKTDYEKLQSALTQERATLRGLLKTCYDDMCRHDDEKRPGINREWCFNCNSWVYDSDYKLLSEIHEALKEQDK